MAKFSAAVKVVDLDDFISPSQECIKPVEIPRTAAKAGTIRIEDDGVAVETNNAGTSQRLAKASITLADCLACSGCVTSAESVLVAEQSIDQLLNVLKASGAGRGFRHLVVTVSPQSVASYAAAHCLTLTEADAAIKKFFYHNGFSAVLNSTLARSIALEAIYKEFIYRLQNKTNLPVITSACPGWVCYAEKSHGEYILPHISSVRSPQAIMGAFVKNFLAKRNGWSPAEIFHLTVMPCFDKKLEASRPDFLIPGTEVKEVDCVISSFELDQLLAHPDLASTNRYSPPPLTEPWLNYPLVSHEGGGSGGYAHHIAKRLAQSCGISGSPEFVVGRNVDFHECTLSAPSLPEPVSIAKAYGFRNIQTIVQKIKRGKCKYHFVEIMACPQGCLNGGGQIRPTDGDSKATLAKVTSLYTSAPTITPTEDEIATQIIDLWLERLASGRAKGFLFTEYHHVPKSDFLTGAMTKW